MLYPSIPVPLCGVHSAHQGNLGYDLLRNKWIRFLWEQFEGIIDVFATSEMRFLVQKAEVGLLGTPFALGNPGSVTPTELTAGKIDRQLREW